MPPKRSRRPQQRRQAEGLTPAVRELLKRGRVRAHQAPGTWKLVLATLADDHLYESLWREHGAEILREWTTAKHPSTRPAGWWLFDAPEPRRSVGPDALIRMSPSDTTWRESVGLPPGAGPFESEPTYLQRLGLLPDAERRLVPKAWWEPAMRRTTHE